MSEQALLTKYTCCRVQITIRVDSEYIIIELLVTISGKEMHCNFNFTISIIPLKVILQTFFVYWTTGEML